MADLTRLSLDPRLMSHSPSPRGESVALPSRSLGDEGYSGSDDEGGKEGENDSGTGTGNKKRRKLNLWKCKQCREARKKVCVCIFLSFCAAVRQCKPSQIEESKS